MQIEVPNTLNAIPLKAYQRFVKKEDPSDIDTLSILLGVDVRIVRNLKSVSVTELTSHLAGLMQEEQSLQRFIKINGKEYGFIPNLDDATAGEINDIEQYIGKFESMHQAMAVMYRPVIHDRRGKYLIEEYVPGKYDEVMKDAPLGAVMGANVFFYNLMKDLSKSTLNYMRAEVSLATSKGILPENGEDMEECLQSLEEMFFDWNKHLN